MHAASARAMERREHLTSGVSIVVPVVYESRDSLRELTVRLAAVLSKTTDRFELIFVNDGSTDDSWSVISDLAAAHPYVRGVDLMRIYGQHNAVLCGIRVASYDLTVTLDDDLQHPPEEIPRLLAEAFRWLRCCLRLSSQ